MKNSKCYYNDLVIKGKELLTVLKNKKSNLDFMEELKLRSSETEFAKEFINLHKLSENDNFVWQYCPSSVYINSIKDKFNVLNIEYYKKEIDNIKKYMYLEMDEDHTILDDNMNEIIKNEIQIYFKLPNNRKLRVYFGIDGKFKDEIIKSQNKKIDYLEINCIERKLHILSMKMHRKQ